jgi:hypothetical protein
MLWEAYHWCSTSCPTWARRSGVLYASIALGARGRRCAAAWAEHLARARLEMSAAPGGETVVILGSGWLHDVPVELLAARYRRVLLVDAVHPAPARHAAKRHPRITLIHADLSGVLEAQLAGVVMPTPQAVDWSRWLDRPATLVVSDLVLSQVAMAAVDCATRRGADPATLDPWADTIRQHHLATLPAAQHRLLLTDTIAQSSDGRIDLVPGVALPPAHATWTWPVVPPGESPDGAVIHTVTAAWS